MPVEAGHIQLTEYSKEVIPKLNYMLEDLFCRYSVSIPYYILDFSFPDYPLDAEWPAPFTPVWLALYRPSLPPWPEHLFPDIPGWQLPEMKLPKWPDIQWPVLPEMAWPEWPDWPNLELPEWEWLKFYWPDWPEWDWPNWESPESRRTRRRRQREELLAELQRTKKRIPIGITPRKPPIELEAPTEKPQWPLIQKPDWFEGTGLDWIHNYNGYNFNINQGLYGYNLRDLNNLLETLFDEADLPVEQLNDLSDKSMELFNSMITILYDNIPPSVLAPVAEFSVLSDSGTADTYFIFIDESTNTPTSWLWDFGDNKTSTSQNVAHTYDTEGKYTVTLTATNAGGSDTEIKTNYITVYYQISSESGDNQILRSALESNYADMITEFETDPGFSYDENSQISVEWYYSGTYAFDARQGYRTFDTTSISGVTTAKIRLGTISEVFITAGTEDIILEVYEYDYGDSLTWQADWTGGIKIAERTFKTSDEGTVVEITIDPSYVNEGGMSKYRFTMKRITDSNYWGDAGAKRHRIITSIPRLILNY